MLILTAPPKIRRPAFRKRRGLWLPDRVMRPTSLLQYPPEREWSGLVRPWAWPMAQVIDMSCKPCCGDCCTGFNFTDHGEVTINIGTGTEDFANDSPFTIQLGPDSGTPPNREYYGNTTELRNDFVTLGYFEATLNCTGGSWSVTIGIQCVLTDPVVLDFEDTFPLTKISCDPLVLESAGAVAISAGGCFNTGDGSIDVASAA